MSATIILLEDDDLVSELYRVALEVHGFNVVCASNSKDIVKLILHWNPALVITDLMMPEHEGMEGIFRLTEVSEVPIIAMSSNAAWLKLAENLVTRTLLKPLCAEFLLENVWQVLQKNPPAD
jgi:DNA-binding response OmpR family regulator